MINQESFDFIVVGAGIAGMTLAIELSSFGTVALISKGELSDTATSWAQGGIAICKNIKSEINSHINDTLQVGRGLCDAKRVTQMVNFANDSLNFLANLGVEFDRKKGQYDFALEAGHQSPRVLHYRDKTGLAIKTVLDSHLKKIKNIRVFENTRVIKLCVANNECHGLWIHSNHKKLSLLSSSHVSLATGGYSQLYSCASTPQDSIGDGIYLAYEAGAVIEDMEMIQFHPTVYIEDPSLQPFLISEAVRGAGAVIVDKNGERFLSNYEAEHELAPRDVLARSIFSHIQNKGQAFLDLASIDDIHLRFPSIYHRLTQSAKPVDVSFIPIMPAAHYTIGGILVDSEGLTTIDSLSAVGECACSRVHGANRLASNSLLDGLVFARLLAKTISKRSKDYVKCDDFKTLPIINFSSDLSTIKFLKNAMWKYAGLYRSKQKLLLLKSKLEQYFKTFSTLSFDEKIMLTNASMVIDAALYRQESRGCHYRLDYQSQDATFLGHIQHRKDNDIVFSSI